MKYVLLIDKDSASREQIKKSLEGIAKDTELVCFNSFRDLYKWIKLRVLSMDEIAEVKLALKGQAVEPWQPGADEIQLIVIGLDIVGLRVLRFLKRIRAYLVLKSLCNINSPTAFLLTAHPKEDFKLKACQNPLVVNVLFKPFDIPVLNHSLKVALSPQKDPHNTDLYVQKATTNIEMLTEVRMTHLS